MFFTNDDNVLAILSLLLPEFCRIFSKDAVVAEDCEIYNSPEASCPMLEYGSPLKIRLAQELTTYWAQTIFQLSHELCHYVIRYFKQDKNKTLSWFEEIMCEAFSLYALDWSARNWLLFGLYNRNPNFNRSIERYLKEELLKEGTLEFSKCNTLESLKLYEETKRPEGERESHRNERNVLWEEIQRNPMECKALCYYQN